MDGTQLVNLKTSANRQGYECTKRLIDLCAAIFLITIFSPIIFAITATLFLTSGKKNVFFIQQRPGKDLVPFCLIKFKTMKGTAKKDSSGLPVDDDMRITRIGKFLRDFSLDEIPQLINIIKGDLSFVGPRPLLMEYIPLYSAEQRSRHDVMPGITGWAQIHGRNSLDWEEKFRLDLWYIKNRGLCLDIKILFKTFYLVIKREGINSSDGKIMDSFTGKNKG